MKRSIPSIIAGVALVSILVLYMITFQVRFSEVAVVRTFGKATEQDVISEPGLCWKWPWPIQKVTKFDNRIHVAVTTGEETPTKDGKNVIVTTSIGWRIFDAYRFSIKCESKKDGEEKLKSIVRNHQKSVIGVYDFANFVATDSTQLKYDQIESEILDKVQAEAKELYGIKVESIGISKLALPQQITQTVFDAMKKERQAVAARYTSEGESEAKKMKDTAESTANTIMSFARRKAAAIVAEGKEQAARYLETLQKDEDLAIYLLEIENLPKILEKRTTVILDGKLSPWHLLRDSGLQASGEQSPTTMTAGAKSDDAEVNAPLPEIVQQNQ